MLVALAIYRLGPRFYSDYLSYKIYKSIESKDINTYAKNLADYFAKPSHFEKGKKKVSALSKFLIKYGDLRKREQLILEGGKWCDEMSRFAKNISTFSPWEVTQFDIIGPVFGHSGINLSDGKKNIFIDPFYGAIFKNQDKLLSFPDILKEQQSSGHIKNIIQPIKENATLGIYDHLDLVSYAKWGEDIDALIEIREKESPYLYGAGSYRMTYGPRLGDQFRYLFKNTLSREINLVFKLETGVFETIAKSNIAPIKTDKTLTYTIAAQETLVLSFKGMERYYELSSIEIQ